MAFLLELFTDMVEQMVRLTIRATEETLPPVLLKLMVERLSKGMAIGNAGDRLPPPSVNEISDSFRNIMVR